MRRRTRLGLFILMSVGVLLLAWAAYAYATRPSVLRARLLRLLESLNLRVVQLGEISFSLTSGVQVADIEVAAAEGWPLAAPAGVQDAPSLLRASRARLGVDLPSLLRGKVRLREINLLAPTLAVVWSETSLDALQLEAEHGEAMPASACCQPRPRLCHR